VDDLPRALLLEETATRSSIAEALFASVNGGISFLQALAVSPAALERFFARRTDAPVLRHVSPVDELVDRLPPGLCARLLAVPVRRDPVTGTIDVAVADAGDTHPAAEIAYHLDAPVRLVRAPLPALEEALRRIRMRRHEDLPRDRFREAAEHAAREAPRRLLIETDSAPPPAATARIRTPPWGTPIHVAPRTEPPKSGYGSEIPIPLTRKSVGPQALGTVLRSGTQRPPALFDPLGEGYPIDTSGLRDVVERSSMTPLGSFIPGPPPLPGLPSRELAFPEMGSVLAALRNARTRDEVLELVLAGARALATKVALFVVKRGGYLGWACSPEFGDRALLGAVLIPLQAESIFDRAIREEIYLGPIRYDEVHAPLLRMMRNPSRDIAAVPIRVSGKTAVIVLADDLIDTMTATRRLEEIAKAAGEAFGRIVRSKR